MSSIAAQQSGSANGAHVQDLKTRLAKVHRILAAGGILPLTKGHVGARVPNADLILVLGHIHADGRTLDTTTEDDICSMDGHGNQVGECGAGLVGERYIHTAILRARPDVNAVVHCHAPRATAFGIAGVHILPIGNRGGIFAPHVPILDFDGQINTPERGELVRDALGDSYGVVLKNHGIVAVGGSIEKACMAAFAMEETAELQMMAAAVGTPQPMSDEEAQRVRDSAEDNEEFFAHVWQHYAAMDPFAQA